MIFLELMEPFAERRDGSKGGEEPVKNLPQYVAAFSGNIFRIEAKKRGRKPF